MKKMFSWTLLLTAAVMLAGCSDDNDNKDSGKPKIEPGTQNDFKDIRDEALDALTITETFDVADGIEFTSPKGVVFKFKGNLYDSEWNQITGKVKLEYIEIFDRGSMVVANKPLIGLDENGNYRPMITGGEFYVNMTQDGKQLQTSWEHYYLTVPSKLTGGLNNNMILWEGTIQEGGENDGDLFWEQFSGWDGQREKDGGVGFENNDYNLFCNEFGWTNIDILAGEEGKQTPLLVSVPEGYDNKNSCVYVAYKGKPGMLAFLDQYVTEEKLFTEHYGWAPVDFQLYVIFTAEYQGKYVYCTKEVTVAEKEIIYVTQAELKTGTREEVIAAINALP